MNQGKYQNMQKIIFLLIVSLAPYFSYAGFSCQDVFRSLSQWKQPRDTLKFVDIPKTNEEQALKRKGHGEQFYAGVDEMNYLIRLGQYLRENSIDPQRTHIENFVPLIARHFQHLQAGWQYYGPTGLGPSKHIRLRVSKIKADMNYRILRNRFASTLASVAMLYLGYVRKTDQPLSLEVWQNLNFWWALLMHPRLHEDPYHDIYFHGERSKKVDQAWQRTIFVYIYNRLFKKKGAKEELDEEIFEQYDFYHSIPFPETIALPTISPLGVFAINQAAGGDRVIPVQLSNRLQKHDRGLQSPFNLFEADLYHFTHANYGQPLFGNPLFHHRLMVYLRQLPPKKREQAEIIYFGLIHELPHLTETFPSINEVTDKQNLLKILSTAFIAPLSLPEGFPDKPTEKSTGDKELDITDRMFENQRKEEQEYHDSLPPEIKEYLNQTDVVVETFDNPRLLEESADIFIQAVQQVIQNNPDIIAN